MAAAALNTSAVQLAGQPLAPRRAARHAQRPVAARQQRLGVRATAQPEPKQPAGALGDFVQSAERVFARYDFLSAGLGALAVTGFCVARGQDAGTALVSPGQAAFAPLRRCRGLLGAACRCC